MNLEKRLLSELKRFNEINTYILNEQDPGALPPAPDAGAPPAPDAGAPPAPDAGAPPAPDAGAPPAPDAGGGEEVPEPVDVTTDPDVEEVGAEKEGEEEEAEEIDITDLVTTQQEIKKKQDEVMDGIFSKLDDFFNDKEPEMEKSGKNEYVLTSDEVENFSPNEIKKTFNIYDEEENVNERYQRRNRRIL